MKTHAKSVSFFLSFFLSIGFLSFAADPVKAQFPPPPASCPTTIPPTSIGWTDYGCYQLTIVTGCVVEVCYCTRTVNGVKQYSIKSLRFVNKAACPDMTYQDAIAWASDIMARGLANSEIVPCVPGHEPTVYEVVASSCWQIVNTNPNPTGTPAYQCRPCPEDAGYCVIKKTVCKYDDDNYTITEISRTFVPGNCLVEAPLLWEPNTCYIFNNCDQ